MAVEVFSRIRKLPRALRSMSLAGDGMLVRLRSASIALFGLATAVGLGLIVFISQLGFPGVFSSPIPGDSTEAGTIRDAIALTDEKPAASPLLHRRHAAAIGHPPRVPRPEIDAGIAGSRRLAASPDAQPEPAAPQPQPQPQPPLPVPEPTVQAPSAPAPGPEAPQASPEPALSPAPAPTSTVESPPKSSSSGEKAKKQSTPRSKSKSKSSGSVPSEAKSDKDRGDEVPAAGGSKGHQSDKADGHYIPPPKSNDAPPVKPDEDYGASLPKPPDPEPPAKQAPEAPDYGAKKEAVDAGKSDKHRH